jgi:hypothetical protein
MCECPYNSANCPIHSRSCPTEWDNPNSVLMGLGSGENRHFKGETEGQLKTLIESMGYQAEKDGNSDWHILKVKDGQSRKVAQIEEAKIKAKIETSQITSANEKRAKRIQQLKAILTKCKDTKEGLKYIKEKMGIELVFHKSPEHDKPFGYTIIDHAEKRVLKGAEVMKLKTLLGEGQSHVDRLEKLVKDENPTNLESLQNYLNDHDLHLVIKNGELHLIDELNGEVYALKDISNLRGVLQSKEAKGIYTTDFLPYLWQIYPLRFRKNSDTENNHGD